MNKPVPNGELIGRLMKRFIYTAGITGLHAGRDIDHHDAGGHAMSVNQSPDVHAARFARTRQLAGSAPGLALVIIGGI